MILPEETQNDDDDDDEAINWSKKEVLSWLEPSDQSAGNLEVQSLISIQTDIGQWFVSCQLRFLNLVCFVWSICLSYVLLVAPMLLPPFSVYLSCVSVFNLP